MSEPPKLERQPSESLTIPERRVVVKDPNELPSNYSETPGGTIFSTTPGGKMDRSVLKGVQVLVSLSSICWCLELWG